VFHWVTDGSFVLKCCVPNKLKVEYCRQLYTDSFVCICFWDSAYSVSLAAGCIQLPLLPHLQFLWDTTF